MGERCRVCGCAYSAHGGDDGHCRTRKVSGWDDKTKAFIDETNCACTGYEGAIPVPPSTATPTDCPHEALPSEPHKCLHCKQRIPQGATK